MSGGNGRFATVLKRTIDSKNCHFPNKSQMNILNPSSLEKYLKLKKPKYFIHVAGLSRPMSIHDNNINKSIDTNIIGTSNIVKICNVYKVKLIYFSTNYVYPGVKGNYKENDPVMPINKYAISKLGGECAVQMYKNSLILRICMTEKPFVHKQAFNDVEMNFMFHEDLAKNLLKLINKKGIINVGGKKQKVINFAKKYNKNIKSVSARKIINKHYPLKQSMNIDKFLKIIKKK